MYPIPTREQAREARTPHRNWLPVQVRLWLYRVATALVPLLIAYGALDSTKAPLWLALTASVLATGTAAAHTPGKDISK